MKKLIFIVLMLLVSFSIFTEQIDLLSSYWDFYSLNFTNYFSMGLGMSTVSEYGKINTVLQNPASLDVAFQGISLSTGYKNEISLGDTLKIKSRLPIVFANYAIDWNKTIDISLGYETTKSYQIKNTYENEIFIKDKKLFYRENSYFLTANLKKLKFIKIGASLILKTILLDEDTQTAYIDRFKKNYFTYNIGIIAIPIKNLNLGLTFSPESSYKITVLNSDDETFSTDKKVEPMQIDAGISYRFSDFTFYYQYTQKEASKDFYLIKNKVEHHTGISFDYKQMIKFLGGFFTSNCAYDATVNDATINLPSMDNEFFVSGGILLHDENLEIGLSVADSHFSNAYTPKTYITFGFSYRMMSLF